MCTCANQLQPHDRLPNVCPPDPALSQLEAELRVLAAQGDGPDEEPGADFPDWEMGGEG